LTFNLHLDIEPKALPRARHSAKDNIVRSYYKRDTLNTFDIYEIAILKALNNKHELDITQYVKNAHKDLYISLNVSFRMKKPKAWSIKKNIAMEYKPHIVKPDTDNLVKMILDRAEGILFDNDKRIYSITAQKVYSDNVGIDLTVNYEIL
jgi:Holliday junction resolvase RusA-like endonuclease